MKKLVLIFIFFLINQGFSLAAANVVPRPEEPRFTKARADMVEKSLKAKGIKDPSVLLAMGKIQRQEFVPQKYIDRAYENITLPIGPTSTISQPFMEALMMQAVVPKPSDKILLIGTGSGFSSALAANIVDQVYSIEIDKDLADTATDRLKHLGYTNVHSIAGDGFFGWPSVAPFDSIIITCQAEEVPPKLVEQLKEGGKIVMPLGREYTLQTLVVITKTKGKMVSRPLIDVQFVPMLGEIKK